MERRTGKVLRIEKASIHDGDGLRTVVFMKGCPLRCQWCSTPESQSIECMMDYGYDATPEQLDIMKNDGPDCNLICSVALYPKKIGYVALETAYNILEGEEINDVVWTELGLLTAKDADSFEAE